MTSIFTDKEIKPTTKALEKGLGITFSLWQAIETFTKKQYPNATAEWKFSGEKFGWSYRISDKKRVLVYLLPRDGFFKVGLVFGDKALEKIYKSDVSPILKTELKEAKKNAEGKGIRITVNDKAAYKDIEQLILFKIAN